MRHQDREGAEAGHAGVQDGPLEARQQFGEEEHDDPLPEEDVVLLHAGGAQGPDHQRLLRTPLQGRVETALRLLPDGRRGPETCLPVQFGSLQRSREVDRRTVSCGSPRVGCVDFVRTIH